ncbi:restriction endonuclease subunit S [Gammaproteobacteria bacterium]|nr:restriction endonuclease subunit S [Gammaproteobacteria bacterium]
MWKTATIGDVLSVIQNGINCTQDKSGKGLKITRIETIADANINFNKTGFSNLDDNQKQKAALNKGDILFSHINSPIHVGKTAIYDGSEPLYHGINLLRLRTIEDVDSKYFNFFLQSLFWSGYWRKTAKQSVNQASVNQTDIKKIPFAYPPLAEQERIVTKLDAAFAEIDRGIKTTQAKESEISRLNTSILSTTLTEHNHKIVKLGSIATVIAGQSPKGEYYNKEERGTPFYQGKKDYGKRYLNEPKVWTDKVTKLAEKDDILLSVRAPIGALNIATQQICIGRGLAAIRPSTKILNDYLFYSLLLISNKLEGSSGAIFNSINKSQIEALEVTLPSIEEQQNIVDKLDAALEKIKLTEYSNEAVFKNFIKLKSAILKQELQSSDAA